MSDIRTIWRDIQVNQHYRRFSVASHYSATRDVSEDPRKCQPMGHRDPFVGSSPCCKLRWKCDLDRKMRKMHIS